MAEPSTLTGCARNEPQTTPNRLRLALLLGIVAVVAVGCGVANAPPEEPSTTVPAPGPETHNDRDDWRPAISGDRVVWVSIGGFDDLDCKILTWSPTDGTTLLADHGCHESSNPRVSGDRVVWCAADGSDLMDPHIFTWTPVDATIQITNTECFDSDPQVSDDLVAWCAAGPIYTWTPTTGATRITPADSEIGFGPLLSGDRVLWTAFDPAWSEEEIFTWTPRGGTVRLTENDCEDRVPRVSGNRLVWCTHDGRDYEIMTTVIGDPE